MAGSNNTVELMGELRRTRVNGGQHQLPLLRTIADLADLLIREKKVRQADGDVVIPLDGVTARSLVIVTPSPISYRLNGSTVDTLCGSITILFDTAVTSLTVRNDDANKDVTVEVWIAT
jgi:hypothetical protein